MRIINKIKRITTNSKPSLSNLDAKFGRKEFQNEFEDMFWKSIRGMNIGSGDEFSLSGELFILNELKDKFFSGIERPWIIFDVGANIGDYAKSIINTFGDEEYKLYCFEPSKKTFEILSTNIEQSQKVFLINSGISNSEKTQTLYTDDEGSGMASLNKRNLGYRNIYMNKSEEVDLTTIDKFCEKNQINKIDFLKLDIEGFELDALKGAQNMLQANSIKYIQFEFGGCNIDTRTFFKDFYFFLNDQYTIYRLLQDGLFEIKEYHEVHEQFNTTNFFAINKNI